MKTQLEIFEEKKRNWPLLKISLLPHTKSMHALVEPLFRNYCSLHILRVLSIHPDPNQVPKNKNISFPRNSFLIKYGGKSMMYSTFLIHDTSHTVWQRKHSAVLIITNFLRFELLLFSSRTPEVRSRKYWISAIKKPNQMANKTLKFEERNWN